MNRYKLNIWDIGGQKSLRTYWRNYFEMNDAVLWVVDCADPMRFDICKEELLTLLQEEVIPLFSSLPFVSSSLPLPCPLSLFCFSSL